MKPETDNGSFLLPTIIGVGLLLLGVAAGARMLGLLPNSIVGFGSMHTIELLSEAAAAPGNAPHVLGDGRARRRCPECGVIVSMREVAANDSNTNGGRAEPGRTIGANGTQAPSGNRYEFVVRMQGGGRRVIIDTIPTRWREGERVIIIDGASPSQQ